MIQLISLSDLLSKSLSLYQKHWKAFVKILLWSLAPLGLAAIYIAFVIASALQSMDAGPSPSGNLLIGLIVLMLASMAISLWMQVRLLQTSLDIVDGKAENHSAPTAWGRVLPLFFWSLLWSIPIMAGFIFFVIPGIWLAVLWSFAAYRLVEKKQPYARGSSKLVSPVWWPVLGRHAVMMVIVLGISSVGQMVTVVIGIVLAILGISGHQLATQGAPLTDGVAGLLILVPTYGIAILIQVLLQFVIIPFKSIFEALLYRSVEHPTTVTTEASQ